MLGIMGEEAREDNIEKKYYSIAEVARMLSVNASLIRFWEKEFPFLRPKKTFKNKRQFTIHDIETIKLIYHLVKEKGYTLEGAKEAFIADKKRISAQVHALEDLRALRDFLKRLRQEMTRS